MSDFDKTIKNMSFLLDDSFQPSLILHLNGDIYYENEPFKIHFDIKNEKNIKEIIDSTSMQKWTEFTERASKSEHILMETISINLCFNEDYSSEMQVLYQPEITKVIAKFNVHPPCKIPSYKTYFNAFKHSANFKLLVDQDGKYS